MTKKNQPKRPVGRPSKVDGRRVQVYLNDQSIQIASDIGDGNVSDGIRKALSYVRDHNVKIQ